MEFNPKPSFPVLQVCSIDRFDCRSVGHFDVGGHFRVVLFSIIFEHPPISRLSFHFAPSAISFPVFTFSHLFLIPFSSLSRPSSLSPSLSLVFPLKFITFQPFFVRLVVVFSFCCIEIRTSADWCHKCRPSSSSLSLLLFLSLPSLFDRLHRSICPATSGSIINFQPVDSNCFDSTG